jgi:hypothetical protein
MRPPQRLTGVTIGRRPRRFDLANAFLCAAAALGGGCATTPALAPTFTYAPRIGTHYVRTVKVVNQTTVMGSPLRQREEQEFVWNVGFSRQGDLTLVTHQLQRLSIRINDATAAEVDGVTAESVSVDLLVSPGPRVLEVRGAERASRMLSSLSGRTDTDSGAAIEPEQVRKIAVALFEMVVRDVVGHATAPGSTWAAMDPDPAIDRKTMRVERLEPCGSARCARVTAEYELSSDRSGNALRTASAFLAQSGVNPADVQVLDAALEYHYEILLEPGTLVDHSASFSRIARVIFVLPQGTQVPVEFRTTLEQTSTFP